MVRFVALLVLAACASEGADHTTALALDGGACPPVTMSGSPDNPRSIVIENGVARVTYPELPNPDQKGAHMLELWIEGSWVPALESWYGDWTFFAAPFAAPAVAAHVLTDTPDLVEIAFEFAHDLDYPGPYGGCYLSGCGIAARDFLGEAVYIHNLEDAIKRVPSVVFVKTIGVARCAPGYFVGYHSTPPLVTSWIESDPTDNGAGERELGLGWLGSVTFASSGVVIRNPEQGSHASLGILEQGPGPWWFATIPPPASAWPLVPFMAEEHPLPSFVWQFAPEHTGIPLVHKMNPEVGADGRPERYQAFLGAVRYESADRAAEPTAAVRHLVEANLPAAWPN